MKKLLLLVMLLLTIDSSQAQPNRSALIPMPNRIETVQGKPFIISPSTTIYCNNPELKFAAETLQKIIESRIQQKVSINDSQKNATIRLIVNPTLNHNERYTLRCDQKGITIEGATAAAVFYGVMTFDQLLLGDVASTEQKQVAPIVIDDAPRFPFRALMLDPARHFLPVEDVKFYIDQMVRYKYNVLQLHLTDDQGWRFEVKSHPKIASKDFYTQAQLADLICYAAERHVEIIPELDIPGHTVAILAAYPELGCTHTDTIKKDVGKTVDLMLCCNNDKVYTLYKDIIREVADVFPSKRMHLGGDEAVVEKNWTKCDRCQALQKQLGYTKASQLMTPFFDKMLGFVRENGKEAILWCELDNIRPPASDYLFPYPKDVTLISWRGGLTPKCQELTAKYGNQLIMAPGEYTYLDYPQFKGDFPEFNNWGMPVTTLEKCYQLDPGYGKPQTEQAHIQGVMGTLWGEAINDINRASYMTYPRGLALAEAGWTQMESRSWESFKQRIYPNLTNLMKAGMSVRVPFEIVKRK